MWFPLLVYTYPPSLPLLTAGDVDLSIQHLEVAGDHLLSGGYSTLWLAVRVHISGNYTLAPDPDAGHHDYRVHMYLSLDAHIDEQVDLRVMYTQMKWLLGETASCYGNHWWLQLSLCLSASCGLKALCYFHKYFHK